jgi:hypothetical protein
LVLLKLSIIRHPPFRFYFSTYGMDRNGVTNKRFCTHVNIGSLLETNLHP